MSVNHVGMQPTTPTLMKSLSPRQVHLILVEQGRQAYREGKSYTSNPYLTNIDWRLSWWGGWMAEQQGISNYPDGEA